MLVFASFSAAITDVANGDFVVPMHDCEFIAAEASRWNSERSRLRPRSESWRSPRALDERRGSCQTDFFKEWLDLDGLNGWQSVRAIDWGFLKRSLRAPNGEEPGLPPLATQLIKGSRSQAE